MRTKKFIFIFGGAIGDALFAKYLLLTLAKTTRFANVEFYAVVIRNFKLVKEIMDPSQINVVDISDYKEVLKLMFSGATVVTQPTFTPLSLKIKLVAKLFSFLGGKYFGFNDKGSLFLCDEILKFDYTKNISETYKMLINEVSGEVMSSPIDYKYDSAEPIKKFKSGIVVHMLAASGTRTPMTSFWRKLINLILDNTNLVVYLTGSQQDSVEINRILDGRAGENRLKNLAGEVNIKELCSLIDESILYIGVDTGITHLASFLHKQSVVIGNRSNPCWLPYYNDKAVIINSKQSCSCDGDRKKDCRIETIEGLKLKCVVDIPVEEVWNAVRRLI